MTTGKVADCKAACKIDLKKGDIVVADRGYQDLELLKYWDGNRIKFVVRHSGGIRYDQLIEMDPKGGENEHIIRNEYIHMTAPESSVYDEPLRRVVVYNEQHGCTVGLPGNYLTLEAEEIAEIYRKRRYVESFFKELKQLPKIKTFIGTTKNALPAQIWTAMCAMLLVRFFQSKAKFKWHTSNLVIFLRMHLFCHVDLWSWLDCPYAYILASLANKTSQVEVEQIVGRILRLPGAVKHGRRSLNMSYVLITSNDFQNTLERIVAGLNNAGFTKRDCRVASAEDLPLPEPEPQPQPVIPLPVPPGPENEGTDSGTDDFINSDPSKVAERTPEQGTSAVDDMLAGALQQGPTLNRAWSRPAQAAKKHIFR